jgi:hypothetical protein
MAQQTEAACLLDTGALYGTRVLLQPPAGDPIFAGFKAGAFSLYFGDEPIYHFDREGRWQRAFVKGTHYLKALDTTVQSIDRVREGENLVLKRRTLGFAEASDLDAQVRATALEVLEALGSNRLARVEPPPKARALSTDALRDMLEQVAGWDAAAWFAHRERYLATYGPLPFLPPDSQNPVIVQATLGHAGGVAFGQGRAAEHYVRTPAEFAEHARAVARMLGQRVAQSRNVFLAGSDVLRRPVPDVAAYLETIAQVFPIEPEASRLRAQDRTDDTPRLDGVHAFLDNPSAPRPARDDWKRFAALHLRRVSLGVESGDPATRRLYRKDWESADLIALVSDLKQAGLAVTVAVLVDAGGQEHAETHLAATAALIEELELASGDIVALLDGSEVRDPAGADLGFTPLPRAHFSAQQARLKEALLPVRTRRGAKVVPYSLEKQGL